MTSEYLVLIYNSDMDAPITRHASLGAAKTYIRKYISDPENAPTGDLMARVEQDLEGLDSCVPSCLGGEPVWREKIWVVPVPYCEEGRTINLAAPRGAS